MTLAACFAHVRRRFYELHVNESSRLATQTVTTMAGLWKIADPHAWLTQTLERIAQGWPISQIDALMPWHFKA